MASATKRRVRALEQIAPVGFCHCRYCPRRVYLFEGDPEPPLDCPYCGRHVVVLVRRCVLVREEGV